MTGETKQDDPIIELTDVVEDGRDADEMLSDDILSDVEISEDSTIELTDIDDFNDVEMDSEPDVQEVELEDPFQNALSGDEMSGNDSHSEEAVAVGRPSDSGDMTEPDRLSVPDEQIEAALERVIEKKFAEKIEPLLFDTMERVILQEIQKIKAALLKDMDQIGPF